MPQCSIEEIPEKTNNKKKRWWGDLFRRSNKNRRKPSDSSSEEEDNRRRGFLGRKRHSDRGSKDVTNSFLINPGLRDVPRGRSLDSVKSPERSTKRRIKAKVEASRELLRDSSSDEASSYTSSLQSGGSFPRRSRAARTERHIRRLSRDLEVQNTNVNKSKWSANVVYQECKEYDRKFRAKARSATPSPAQSPKIKRPAGRATSFDNIKSSPPPPPPRKLPEQRPVSLDTPMRVYHPPVYTAPPQPKTKARYQTEYVPSSEPWLTDQSPEDAKKPPTAPPRRQITSEEHRRQQNNLEEALNELEAIYKKLASEDGTDNTSEMAFDEKRPLEDDMAYRRLNKREPSCQDMREIMSQAGSYLLVSPTLSPPPITPHSPIANGQEPDIISDDVVYRTMQHTNNTLKISDPQLPFGIPIGPISPSPPSDYLHVEVKPRFDYKPSKVPDVIRDDLAFRNLRKDSRDLKKKKAVRSLSANLTNIIRNNNNFNVHNNNFEGKSHSVQDIPEELRMAQYVYNARRRQDDEDEEANKRYLTELYVSENDLLRELEEEARATSVQLDEELRQLSEQQQQQQGAEPSVEALYSRSMTDLLKELTKNLDYDFGFNDETTPVVVANCQTCDQQSTTARPEYKRLPDNGIRLSANNNRRNNIAESRRKFFESPEFNKKIERESFVDRAFPRLNRDYQRDNPFLYLNRSPSNPESSYNEKLINGNEYAIPKSPLRTGSADSSGCKENIQSFIERPFTRTSRSPVLETTNSFNGSYSPRMSRSPVTTNGKAKSFSNETDSLGKEFNTPELFNRNTGTRSPVQFGVGKKVGKYDDYNRNDGERIRDTSLYELRQRLKSPTVDSADKMLFGKTYNKGRSPIDFNSSEEILTRYTQPYRNHTTFDRMSNMTDGVGSSKKSNYGSFDSDLNGKPRINSEDGDYFRVSSGSGVDDNAMSRSFDGGLISLVAKKGDDKVSYTREHEVNSLLDDEELCRSLAGGGSSASWEAVREHSLENNQEQDCVQYTANIKPTSFLQQRDIKMSDFEQPGFSNTSLEFKDKERLSISPTVEAAKKRQSFAGSADVHVDDHFTREMERLRPIRTSSIDVEAIERDSCSREPSPPNGCCTYARDEGSSSGVVSLARNDVTNLREDDGKQGSLVWTAYWLACSHQLIGLDVVTIFAVILAMISIVLFILV